MFGTIIKSMEFRLILMMIYLLMRVFLASRLMDLAPEVYDRVMALQYALIVFSRVLRPSIVLEIKFWGVNCSNLLVNGLLKRHWLRGLNANVYSNRLL